MWFRRRHLWIEWREWFCSMVLLKHVTLYLILLSHVSYSSASGSDVALCVKVAGIFRECKMPWDAQQQWRAEVKPQVFPNGTQSHKDISVGPWALAKNSVYHQSAKTITVTLECWGQIQQTISKIWFFLCMNTYIVLRMAAAYILNSLLLVLICLIWGLSVKTLFRFFL